MYCSDIWRLESDHIIPHKKTVSSAQQGTESDDGNFPCIGAQSLQVDAKLKMRLFFLNGTGIVAAEGAINNIDFWWVMWQQAWQQKSEQSTYTLSKPTGQKWCVGYMLQWEDSVNVAADWSGLPELAQSLQVSILVKG